MMTISRNQVIYFVVLVIAAAALVIYYYQGRLALMRELVQSGVIAIYQGGDITRDDIRHYFKYPPVVDSSILHALEMTPEDLSGLEQEEPAWLRSPPGQLLLSRVIKDIALVNYLNGLPDATTESQVADQSKAYQQSLMFDLMEVELQTITPTVTQDEMMDYYVKNRDEFHREGKRLARHLMLVDEPEEEGEGEIHSATADAILKALVEGDDFIKLVLSESESESVTGDGLLGWQPKGALAKSFENVLWSLDVGEITGPIRIGDTLHFIQLLDEQPRGLMDFEECRPLIHDTLIETKRAHTIYKELGLPDNVIRSPNPSESVEYRQAILQRAYGNHFDQKPDIITSTAVYTTFKRADLRFQQFVEERRRKIQNTTETENTWVLENDTAEQLLKAMRFHFLVHLDLPQEETME